MHDVKHLKRARHMVLLLFKILRLEQKIVNQLSRRITNSLFSLECFVCLEKVNLAMKLSLKQLNNT